MYVDVIESGRIIVHIIDWQIHVHFLMNLLDPSEVADPNGIEPAPFKLLRHLLTRRSDCSRDISASAVLISASGGGTVNSVSDSDGVRLKTSRTSAIDFMLRISKALFVTPGNGPELDVRCLVLVPDSFREL
jgi:hypothetical protein